MCDAEPRMQWCDGHTAEHSRNVAGEERPAGGTITRAGQRWAVPGALLFWELWGAMENTCLRMRKFVRSMLP